MWFPLAARPKLGSVAAVPVSKQPFVVQAGEEKPLRQDGWFDSGDVAVLDEDNRSPHRSRPRTSSSRVAVKIASSIDVENPPWDVRAAEAVVVGYRIRMGRTAVARCRATGPCDRDRTIDRGASGRQDRKWWTPNDVVFVEALSYGATDKSEDEVAPPLRRPIIRQLRGRPA
jgi:fatty-acyl-CoA synthase